MGKPVNMNPEEYARQIILEQQAYIAELEAELERPGQGPPGQQPANVVDPSLYERDADRKYQGEK